VTTDSNWPVLLAEYKSAVERLYVVSRSLGSALAKPAEGNDELSKLLPTEAQARIAFSFARARLMKVWRDGQIDLGEIPPSETTQRGADVGGIN
jgi:hypothetical protein